MLHTAVGQGLFDFGHVDGPAEQALFQHPLGVCALANGTVLVADTYNGSIRRYDPAARRVSTVASGLAEPSDVLVAADGSVVVVESGAHRLTRIPIGDMFTVDGQRMSVERPPTDLAQGEVQLEVVFTPAPGQKLDGSFGPATRLTVSASPPSLLLDGEGESTSPACHLTRQDWGVPVRVRPEGAARLPLVLRGSTG